MYDPRDNRESHRMASEEKEKEGKGNAGTVSSYCVDYRETAEKATRTEGISRLPLREERYLEDFLGEEKFRDEHLSGHTPSEEIPVDSLSNDEVSLPDTKNEGATTRRAQWDSPSKWKGLLCLFAALGGVLFLVNHFSAGRGDLEECRKIDFLIRPIVMQDPEPFSCIEGADPKMIFSASLWHTIFRKIDTAYEEDLQGRTVIPMSDIQESCKLLFGNGDLLPEEIEDNSQLYTVSEDKQRVFISADSTDRYYLPYTEKITKEKGTLTAKVGYISPSDPYRADATHSVKEPEPEKYMTYVLKENREVQGYNVWCIQPCSED